MHWWRVTGLTVLIVAIALPTVILGLPLAVRGFVRAIVLLMDGCVWIALSIGTGASIWSVVATIGRSTLAAFVTPMASGILLGLVAICLFALYLLQRLLGPEEESFK